MKGFVLKVGELLCVAFLVLFIFFISSADEISDKTAKQVAVPVVKAFVTKDLNAVGKKELKKELGLDYSLYDGYYYFASDEIMNVREVLVLKLKDTAQGEEVMAILESRVNEKFALFEDYAPEESALLKDYILVCDKGFVYYAVGETADEGLSAFKSSL